MASSTMSLSPGTISNLPKIVNPRLHTTSSPTKLTNPFLTQKINLHAKINGYNFSNRATRSSSITCCNIETMQSTSSNPDTKVQELYVYEFNELDRGSPVQLRLSGKDKTSLGDMVAFTNKIYSGDLKKRLGITAGLLVVMNAGKETEKGDTYEATFSFYFGDYGHISCQGPYKSFDDTWMAVTGGTGIFEGVTGQVKCHNLFYPLKLNYVFYLRGIAELPDELTRTPVKPNPLVMPSLEAKLTLPDGVVSNFTD